MAEHGLLVKVETWKYIEECISNTPPLSLEVSCVGLISFDISGLLGDGAV